MSKIDEIIIILKELFHIKNNNLKAVVTAGPTREYVDPVRYISTGLLVSKVLR